MSAARDWSSPRWWRALSWSASAPTWCAGRGVACLTFDDALLVDPQTFAKDDGRPYTVFTPFYRKASQREVRKPAGIHAGTFARASSPFGSRPYLQGLYLMMLQGLLNLPWWGDLLALLDARRGELRERVHGHAAELLRAGEVVASPLVPEKPMRIPAPETVPPPYRPTVSFLRSKPSVPHGVWLTLKE